MENNNTYSAMLDNLKNAVSAIDRKTGTMLSAASFITAAIGLIRSYIQVEWFYATIVFCCISILFFILSVVPIFKIGKESNDNPLYIMNVKVKKDNTFILKEPTDDDYLSQISKLRLILRIKYVLFYIGVSSLCLSLITFLIGLFL